MHQRVAYPKEKENTHTLSIEARLDLESRLDEKVNRDRVLLFHEKKTLKNHEMLAILTWDK